MKSDISSLAEQILDGDRRALSQAITLIESTRIDDRENAFILLEKVIPYSGNSIRLGVSGVPGVGKSTFIEAIGNHVIQQGHRLAVLTIDPSSSISGGSILGDKTRMNTLSRREEVFIRPSPTGSTLGGVSRRSRETMILCEAAGYDVVMIETVGVGQSETEVSNMTDMFLLLLLPGAGDELQGIKRGIMELADLVLINKADDDLTSLALRAQAEFRNALRILNPTMTAEEQVDVLTCSSRDASGLSEVWTSVNTYVESQRQNGRFSERRTTQAKNWMWMEVYQTLLDSFKSDNEVRLKIPDFEAAIKDGTLPPTLAARKLLDIFLKK